MRLLEKWLEMVNGEIWEVDTDGVMCGIENLGRRIQRVRGRD